MNAVGFLLDNIQALYVLASGLGSGLLAWLLAMSKMKNERATIAAQATAAAVAAEQAERTAFRATLIGDIANLRTLVSDCEAHKDELRGRLSTAENQIQVLKAANEIMERWVAFFKNPATTAATLAGVATILAAQK